MNRKFKLFIALTACLGTFPANTNGFEGKIDVVITRGGKTTSWLYTIKANFLRIEVTGSKAPEPINIFDLKPKALTLLFPHNRSFVRVKPENGNTSAPLPGVTTFPTPPPGMGPQSQANKLPAVAPPLPTPSGGLPPGIGPQSPGVTAPNIPPMPPPVSEEITLRATGKKDKILSYACEQYEIKQRGETMEIWATDKLLPFQPYMRNQAPLFGPRMIEEQWAELLTAKKLFPLRASLRFDEGGERFRFEVKSITPQRVEDKDDNLFRPPPDYTESEPLPF